MASIEELVVKTSDLDPDVFEEKTVGSKKYVSLKIGISDNGNDTNEVQFGKATKVVKDVTVSGKKTSLIFTEVMNHNQQGKRMFVCTDVVDGSNSLLEDVPSEPSSPPKDNAYNFALVSHNNQNDFIVSGFLHSGIVAYPYTLSVSGLQSCSIADELNVTSSAGSLSMVDVAMTDISLGTFDVTISSPPPTDELTFTFGSSGYNYDEPHKFGLYSFVKFPENPKGKYELMVNCIQS